MRRGLLTLALAAAAFGATAAQANAAAPTIVNSSQWLESLATSGENGKNGNYVTLTALVKHDPGATLSSFVIDEDWDGTNDPTTVRTVTAQRLPSRAARSIHARPCATRSPRPTRAWPARSSARACGAPTTGRSG